MLIVGQSINWLISGLNICMNNILCFFCVLFEAKVCFGLLVAMKLGKRE